MWNKRLALRIGFAFLLLPVAGCFWSAGTNLWTHLRMRTIPVEVVRSSLLLDAPGDGSDLNLILRLDLKTTDGAERLIYWADAPGRAAYPEEGYDELHRWAPGTRHRIYQIRGQAQEFRQPGVRSPELVAMTVYLSLGCFIGFFFFVFWTVANEDGPRRFVGTWTVFFLVGVGAMIGSALFTWYEIPKRLYWPPVVATLEPVPEPMAEAPPKPLPDNVVITPAGRQLLERSPYKVLQFNGIHAGLGNFGGSYEQLAERCASGDQECRFLINPNDRWDVELDARWDESFFFPLGMFLVFGLAFGGGGLMIRRLKF